MLLVAQDGIVGEQTLSQLNNQEPKDFSLRLLAERRAFVERICIANPSQRKFLRGWLNRINSL